MTINTDTLKQQAAGKAVDLVNNGMVVGLGSGSTAAYAIDMLAQRVKEGLNIVAIATSEHSHRQAEQAGIRMTSFAHYPFIDLTIDGADQVERSSLNLIKGLGGALLREKIVALASKKLIIIVDESKVVDVLGERSPLPVEVIPFGMDLTKSRINRLCSQVNLRLDSKGEPTVTDSGNYILDCQFGKIENAAALDRELKLLTGVAETGLFVNLTTMVIVAAQNGISYLTNG